MTERTHYIPPEAYGSSIEEQELVDVLGIRAKAQWSHLTPQYIGTKTQALNIPQMEREMTSFQNRFQEARITQPEGLVKFDTELPISVFFVGDVHYGSLYTDHKRFRREMEEIKATPNAYIVFMSNLIDNAIPSQFPDGMLSNSIPPDKQVIAMRQIVQDLDQSNKVLGAVTSDCHEGWTAKATGQDVNALIYGFEGRNFPVLENGGRLNLKFPKSKYTLGLYHKIGPFRSNFNYTHGLKQMNRLKQGMECDVIVGAHYHCGSVEETYEGNAEHRKMHIYVQSGTYKGVSKIHDQWSMAKFGSTGQPSAQSVTFWADQRRMMGHLEYDTGILAHESIYLTEMVKKDG